MHDRLAEEILCQWHDHEGCDRAGPGGFAEHRDSCGITAEGPDLLLHPAQRGHLVKQRPVGWRATKFGVPVDTDPMIGGDNDDPGASKCRAVKPRHGGGSEPITAAVDPHHYR